ncbi:MAG: lipopolysaccharide biosynthesis protein [Terriglobia bacterium]
MRPFDASGAFRPIAEEGGLRRRAVRGAGVTVFSGGFALGVQLVATVILARLLTPADFGVVAMVTTFSLILMNVGLNGFTEAVVQAEEINHFLASNLFWINVGASLVLTVGFAAAGSLLARLYHNPLVANVTIAVSLTIFLTSASVLHLALLKRAMLFSWVSANDIVARAVSVAVSVLLAFHGWGYWALVAGVVALPLSTSAGAWAMCRWTPGLPRRADGMASLLRFAVNVYARFGVRYGARNLDKLLVGWRFNASALGFYKKAYDLFLLPTGQLIGPLTVVAVSTLSRLNRDPVKFRRFLMNSLAIVAFVGMGLGADLTLTGKDVVRMVLGPGWEESGRIFIFFGPGVGLMLIHGVHGWIHLSIGRADRWLRWTIGEFAFTTLLFFASLPWGPDGMAAAWTASFVILTFPALWYAGRPIRLGIAPVVAATWKYIAASLVAGLVCAAILRAVPSSAVALGMEQALARIVLVSVLFGALYLGLVIMLHRGCAPLYQFAGVVKEMLPWSKPSRLDAPVVVTHV